MKQDEIADRENVAAPSAEAAEPTTGQAGAEHWYAANNAYLGKALEWLRLKLELLAQRGAEARGAEAGGSAQVPAPEAGASRRPRSIWGRQSEGSPPAQEISAAKTPPVTAALGSQVDAARVEQAMASVLDAAAQMDPPPALLILSYRFGLSRFEREILLLCAALELDPRTAGLCARAQDSPVHPFPTYALALALFDEPSWDALSAGRPLRYWRLIEINQPGATPLTASALRADERIVAYLKGINQLDDRLAPLLLPFENGEGQPYGLPPEGLPASQEAAAKAIAASLKSWAGLKGWEPSTQPPLFQLIGRDSVSKQAVVRRALSSLEWQSYRLHSGLLPTVPAELESFTRLWQRESTLLPLALYLELPEEASAPWAEAGRLPERQAALYHFLSRCGATAFIDTVEPQGGLGAGVLTLEIAKPTPSEQAAAWRQVLSAPGIPADLETGRLAAQLSAQFNINLPAIRAIVRRIKSDQPEGEPPEAFQARLWQECLQRTRPRLERMAQRIEAKATWDDLILPPEPLAQLYEIAAQVRQRSLVYEDWGFRQVMNRGFGISALFSGESGTGKTMAAEVIANELNLYLYRIDLSAVVSKYIGETEKNLRQAFDAAEDGGAILFFDEADALFGKRSEVKDSHDRYANIEINYLLQRMEAFGGLAILATNMKSALDPAFWRRLRFIVHFPFPSPAERRLIWEKVLPLETPRQDLDYAALAKLNLTGGSIHNVGLNAAFRAAQAGSPVTMELLSEAARSEYRKLERPINEADFRPLKIQERRV